MLLHRPVGERHGGLGGAVVAGLALARGTWVCVMDGDLQHPPESILEMLAAAESRHATLVVASRYRAGGDSNGLDGVPRRVASRAASGAAKALFWRTFRDVTDPMSGFFLVRRDAVDGAHLRPNGFKILMELAVRTPSLRVAEVPYTFEARHAGESKAGYREAVAYLRHLALLRADVTRSKRHTRLRRGRTHARRNILVTSLEAGWNRSSLHSRQQDARASRFRGGSAV